MKSIILVGCLVLGMSPVVYGAANANVAVAAEIDEDVLQQNYAELERQNIIVTVLAGQYNKELKELQGMEAIFCDHYKLDVEVWRKGGYVWSTEKKMFEERAIEENVENLKK